MAKSKLFTEDQPVDTAVLSVEDIAAVEKEVAAEVAEEARAKAREGLKAKLKLAERRKHDLEEAHEEVVVDLAPYCDRILIDNRAFLQGQRYTVRVSQAQVMREAMQRTWRHQSEIDGKASNFYQRARNTQFSAMTGAVHNSPVINTSQLLRA